MSSIIDESAELLNKAKLLHEHMSRIQERHSKERCEFADRERELVQEVERLRREVERLKRKGNL